MKTLQQVVREFKSNSFDGRDESRLVEFLTEDQLNAMGIELNSEWKGKHKPSEEFTRENVLSHLESDLDFAFEKALDQRGLSASAMFCVIKMWNWILEDGLEDWDNDDYAQYGLPLFKATALKYGFNNPIGEDSGSENKYAC